MSDEIKITVDEIEDVISFDSETITVSGVGDDGTPYDIYFPATTSSGIIASTSAATANILLPPERELELVEIIDNVKARKEEITRERYMPVEAEFGIAGIITLKLKLEPRKVLKRYSSDDSDAG